MDDRPGTWTCNEETGAIFNGEGTLIGVADRTSAKSIVAMHNRELDGLVGFTLSQTDFLRAFRR